MTTPPVLRLAGDIAAQFRHRPPQDAARVIADHVTKFWDPRMRAQLIDLAGQAGAHCDPVVAAAAELLKDPG